MVIGSPCSVAGDLERLPGCDPGAITSKAVVRLMTKSIVVRHVKDKIHANSVHPGIMPLMRSS
jgi:NAD(P)-dependent dehydrogenase (short-subunit alcohol dehydrogenase family)